MIYQSLIKKFNCVARSLNRRLYKNFKEKGFDITPEQWSLLRHLWQKDGLSQQQLCEYSSKDRPSITRLVNNMVKRKLVLRKSHKKDKRMNLIFLSKKGKELEKALKQEVERTLNEAIKDIKDSQLIICAEVMNKILLNLK